MTEFEKQKKELSDKYADKFYTTLKNITVGFKGKLNALMGEEYIVASKRYDEVLLEQKTIKSEFLNSREYLDVKDALMTARKAAETAGDVDLDDANKAYKNALFDMAAVNAKLNNKLKKSRVEADEIKEKLKNEFFLRKKELNGLKASTSDEILSAISSCLLEYNKNLKQLCEEFGEKYDKTEYPFDVSKASEFGATGKLESDLYFYISNEPLAKDIEPALSENEGALTMIACDNDSLYKN